MLFSAGQQSESATCIHAAAALLQSCPTLCDPIDGSPPGSPVPGIFQALTLEWVAISFSNAWKWKVKVKSLSCVRLLATPWTAAYQAPPPMGFFRQEYWSGVPWPSLHVCIYALFLKISFPFRSPQSTGLGSLCCIVGSHYAQVNFRQYLFVSDNDKEELRSVINQSILFIQMSLSQVSLQVISSYLWDFFLRW